MCRHRRYTTAFHMKQVMCWVLCAFLINIWTGNHNISVSTLLTKKLNAISSSYVLLFEYWMKHIKLKLRLHNALNWIARITLIQIWCVCVLCVWIHQMNECKQYTPYVWLLVWNACLFQFYWSFSMFVSFIWIKWKIQKYSAIVCVHM